MSDKSKPSLILSLAVILTPITAIIIFALYKEKYFVALGATGLLAFMVICQIASHYFYYRKHEPEIIEADEEAAKGAWLPAVVGFAPIVLLDVFQSRLGIPDRALQWAILLPAGLVGGHLYFRTRKLRRKARQKIAERKAREQNAQGSKS